MVQKVRARHKARTEIYLDPSEKKRLKVIAKDLNLSLSELCRRLLLDKPVPNKEKFEALKGLYKINGDLARLGNLYRMAERRTGFITDEELERAYQDVKDMKLRLRVKIDEVNQK